MSALDELIKQRPDLQYAAFDKLVDNARAELAALCAEVTALQQAVDEAREIIALSHVIAEDHSLVKLCSAWLAAHPVPEQVTI